MKKLVDTFDMNYARQPLSFIKKLPCRRHDSDTQNNVPQGFSSKMCRFGEILIYSHRFTSDFYRQE